MQGLGAACNVVLRFQRSNAALPRPILLSTLAMAPANNKQREYESHETSSSRLCPLPVNLLPNVVTTAKSQPARSPQNSTQSIPPLGLVDRKPPSLQHNPPTQRSQSSKKPGYPVQVPKNKSGLPPNDCHGVCNGGEINTPRYISTLPQYSDQPESSYIIDCHITPHH